MKDYLGPIIQVGIGLIAVPFLVWVVASVYELKLQTALISQELSMLRKVCEKLLG